ncbi:Nucleolar Complex 2 protein, partial [Coemansia sp. S610]
MGKAKKSTKKFNQRHLKDELERRKEHKKTQKLVQKREVKKKRRANGSTEDEGEAFTGVEEIDDLAGFAESKPKGALAKLDLSKFTEADPTAAGDDVSDDEDIAALLEGDEDEDDDDMPSDSDPEDEGSDAEVGGEDEDEDDEEAVFKRELEAVSKKDPKFLEFMKKNDPSSLAILEDDDEGSEDEEGDEEEAEEEQDEDAAMSDAEEPQSSDATVVTSKMLEDWEKDITENQSLKSLKRLLLAFYSASHMESENESAPQTPYRIEGMRIFNKTVTASIRAVPKAFNHYAPIVNDKVAQKSGKKWGIAQALIKSYLVSLLELLKQMSDPAMIQYLIKESERMIPYFVCFTRYTREFVKE